MKIIEIGIGEKQYPQMLKKIEDPPKKLYILGNKEILNQRIIGMVGCRQCSQYGKQVAEKLAYELSMKNYIIISGLAKGIDGASHWGAVKGKKKTIAVLGCGLDIIYPVENRELYFEILKTGGAIISEYPIGTKPLKANFPARNRIISGMSEGVIVVEAKKKSGTMITVEHALEQGKEVFAVPGDITKRNSEGTNQLIKEGAKIITSLEDIIEELR